MSNTLKQWPVQIKLIDPNHQAFHEDELVIAADCTSYAYSEFSEKFGNKTLLIGCPKLDDIDYSEKLTEIIKNGNIKKVIIVRMVVPCCFGIENMAKRAIEASGKDIEVETYVVDIEGELSEG